MEVNRHAQQENLEILVNNKGFQFTEGFFPYTSGQIGPYYVQSAVIMGNGTDYYRACEMTQYMIRIYSKKYEVISGGESRDWIFSFPVASRLHLPHAMIYKDGKILGANMEDKNIAHVADLNNEGSSPRDLWVPAIKKAGGIIEDIFFYVDRMEDGAEVMKELGLNSHALVPLDQPAWDYLQKINVVTPEIYKSLSERGQTRESRKQWAYNMLRSDKGIEKLASLYQDEKNYKKAKKIVEVGYPELEAELKDRLFEKGLSRGIL
jgi:orotate phosphoribosyltransferase